MTLFVTVLGLVQGVGYRPFVARLAREMCITGTVQNSGGVVRIEATGTKEVLDRFINALSDRRPPGAVVTKVLVKPGLAMSEEPENHSDFRIIQSGENTEHIPLLPADLPMCETCGKELSDPRNRRFRYPFISCANCGPRYSIMNDLPYDRETSTMDVFPLCPSCKAEYSGDDRRRHAQTISCHDCGPQLILKIGDCVYDKEDALSRSISILQGGGILALKGIGGYQLACLPANEEAVKSLRAFKNRDKKPFAVMFPGINAIETECTVTDTERTLLLSSPRPIVLLPLRKNSFCPEVNGESRFQGAFLPYTALHLLLTEACGPLVMTSANLSDEPVMYRDENMLSIESSLLSGILYNKREIVTPLDDSVAHVVAGRAQLIRRSRGYVPLPVFLGHVTPRTVFASGGDLKGCFCLYRNDRAYMSQYFGDMEIHAVQKNYTENVNRMERLFRMEPDTIACDLHPLYISSSLAERLAAPRDGKPAKRLVRVQHHHAHAASVMAEHGLDSCIAVAFDGTGYGTDGAVWGGEFLLCGGASFTREAHLSYVTLCGGDEAARKADLAASCYLAAAGEKIAHPDEKLIRAALAQPDLTQRTSSMGRLFDAVSSVLGICAENTYEGECAIMLENAAEEARQRGISPYDLHFSLVHGTDGYTADQVALLKEIYRAVCDGTDRKALALGFHIAVAEMVLAVCDSIRDKSGESRVALSGGVFANMLLTETCVTDLENAGFSVYLNEAVPTNDGGISLGQAWICSQMPD